MLAEIIHTTQQVRGVERHINARNQNERPQARGLGLTVGL